MRVLVTGATGFIGSYLVPHLIRHGHRVVGLARSKTGADRLADLGAEALLGDVNDLDCLRAGLAAVDGVIHTAFNHDFSNLRQHSEEDRRVIEALGDGLTGSGRPLVIASGTGLTRRSRSDGVAVETDGYVSAAEFARAASEEAADAVVARGGRAIVVRLSQVHDTRHQGRIAQHIKLAREKGWVAYVGEGANRLAAVHVTDAAELFRLALESGQAGKRYNAVTKEGVAIREVAEVLGAGLKLPVRSIEPAEAEAYFGWLAGLAQADLAASSALTRVELGWRCTGPDLLTDLRNTDLRGME